MDYEKKYKEALNLAKSYYGKGTNEFLDTIFPELTESEDEKTRKEIIQFFRDASNGKTRVINSNTFAEWADYLENQKEPKSIKDAAKEATKDKESAEKFLKTAGIVDENGNLAEIYRSEQEPTEVDNEEIELSDFESELFSAFSDGWQQYLHGEEVDVVQWAKEHSAQLLNAAKLELKSTEWSEEEEFISEHELKVLKLVAEKDGTCLMGLYNKLKSLRPQPQHRDTYYDIIHDILATLKDIDFMQITPEHRVSLLNDIRVKCKNADECATILDEPHWKPSEEQMKALKVVARGFPTDDPDAIDSLLTDLQKLL